MVATDSFTLGAVVADDVSERAGLERSLLFPFVLEGFQQGMSTREVMRHYGIAHSTVRKYFYFIRKPEKYKEWGEAAKERMRAARATRRAMGSIDPVIPARSWSLEEERQLKVLHRAGKTYGQIACIVNRSRSAVAGKVDRMRATGEIA